MNNSPESKVLFIGGLGRSGSTVLGNVLNEADGFFHAGELCSTFHFGLGYNYKCGCGKPFRSCTLWQSVFEQAFGSMEAMKGFKAKRPTSKRLLLHLIGLKSDARLIDQVYLDALDQLYRAIRVVTGCRVIVDSSKFPAHAFLLLQIPSIKLKMLHLVRDPRGNAYSCHKKVVRKDIGEERDVILPRFSSSTTAMRWLLMNMEIETLGRRSGHYMHIRYEDLMQSPESIVENIIEFAGESSACAPRIVEKTLDLGLNHIIMGNPSRSRTGAVQLRLDEDWKQKMRKRDQTLVTLIDWPLMLKYRYSLS